MKEVYYNLRVLELRDTFDRFDWLFVLVPCYFFNRYLSVAIGGTRWNALFIGSCNSLSGSTDFRLTQSPDFAEVIELRREYGVRAVLLEVYNSQPRYAYSATVNIVYLLGLFWSTNRGPRVEASNPLLTLYHLITESIEG